MNDLVLVFKEVPMSSSSYDTGVGKYLLQLAKGMSPKWNVTILTQNRTFRFQKLSTPFATVFCLPFINLEQHPSFKILEYLIYNLEIAIALVCLRMKRGHRFLIEFANWEVEGTLFLVINTLMKLPVIIRLHSGVMDLAKSNNKVRWSDRFISSCEHFAITRPEVTLVCSTKAHARSSMHNYRSSKDVQIIPLGVEVPELHPKPSSKRVKFLFYGRIEVRKGIVEFLSAAQELIQKYSHVEVHIAGRDYSSLLPKLLSPIPKKVRTQIHVHGYLTPAQLDHLIRSVDICVFLPYYESFGLTIAEAMSYGKAVISTQVGGIPEIITNEENGLLITSKSAEAFRVAAVRLIEDTRLRRRLAKHARESIQKKFTLSLMAERSHRVYNHALNSV